VSKLKIRIEKFEKAIVCQILEMDERFRSKNKVIKYIASK